MPGDQVDHSLDCRTGTASLSGKGIEYNTDSGNFKCMWIQDGPSAFLCVVKMVPACRKPVIKQGDWPVHVKKELRMQVEFLHLLDEILNLRLPMGGQLWPGGTALIFSCLSPNFVQHGKLAFLINKHCCLSN